ncbi:HEAT repeats [uncultured archaeon]|nr:HEAT repeats [uncultured archaeon]
MPLHIDLKEMKKRGDIEGLLSVLDTGDLKDMGEAIRMLGELRSRKAIRPLVSLLEKDNIQVRANSAWALGEIGEVKAVLPLIGLLNDPSDNVRVYAAWALGKIGDTRALNALNAALKNGSQDLRKHAREAITRIDSNKLKGGGDDNGSVEEEPQSQETTDLALVTLDVPLGLFECDYVSKVEGESRKGNTMRFSGDVSIEDTVNSNQENTRRIILGLKNDFKGLVSIDVLFKYLDNDGGEKTSSVWLQMESVAGETYQEPAQAEEVQRRKASRQVFKKARIKPGRKQVSRPDEYETPDNGEDEEPQPEEQSSFEENVPVQEVQKKKGTSRRKPAPVEPENPEPGQASGAGSQATVSHETVIEEPQAVAPPKQEIKPEVTPQPQAVEKPQVAAPPIQEAKPEVTPQPQVVEKPQAVAPPIQEAKPEVTQQPQEVEKPQADAPQIEEDKK